MILYDNMKTIITRVDERGHAVWNERFSRFADHHGFLLQRCQPYRARTKGKVESGIKYVRKNFGPRVRTFTGLDDLNRQALLILGNLTSDNSHRLHPACMRGGQPANTAQTTAPESPPQSNTRKPCRSWENARPQRLQKMPFGAPNAPIDQLNVMGGVNCVAHFPRISLFEYQVSSAKVMM